MIKLLKRMAAFAAFASVIYIGLITITARIPAQSPLIHHVSDYHRPRTGSSFQRFHEYDPSEYNEVIILGSSHAMRGYNPFVFIERGYSAYNLGSVSQPPSTSYYILKNFLTSENTGLVVLDVFEIPFTNTGFESTTDLMFNQPDLRTSIELALAIKDMRAVNLLGIRLFSPKEDNPPTQSDYQGRGFIPFHGHNPAFVERRFSLPIRLNASQMKYLRKCILLCRQRGIPLVITSHYGRDRLKGEGHEPLSEFVLHTIKDTPVPYLDFTDKATFADTVLFWDGDHLNLFGANVFTVSLIDTLESLGYLRPKH